MRDLTDYVERRTDQFLKEPVLKSLLHPQSHLHSFVKKEIIKSSLAYVYPIQQYTKDTVDGAFFDNQLPLLIFGYLQDLSLDGISQDSNIRCITSQTATYFLIKYLEWLKVNFGASKYNLFLGYYIQYSEYLILEKDWSQPEKYIVKFGLSDKIFYKALILLFPFELFKKKLVPPSIRKLFIDYFSFVLLADDILDFSSDLKMRNITYPMALLYKKLGKLPSSPADMLHIKPDLTETLRNFLRNIQSFQGHFAVKSSLMEKKVSEIRKALWLRDIQI